MEQLQQLIGILEQTPKLALWGVGIFATWKLLTMASIVGSIAFVLKLFISKYFAYKSESVMSERAERIYKLISKHSVDDDVTDALIEELIRMKNIDNENKYIYEHSYIHRSDVLRLRNAITKMKDDRTKSITN